MRFNLQSFTGGVIAGLIGSVIVYGAGEIKSAEIQKTKILVDGKQMELSEPTFMVGILGSSYGNLYGSLREVFEKSGYGVNWNEDVLELTSPHPAMARFGKELLVENMKEFPNSPADITSGFRIIYALSSSGNGEPKFSNFTELMNDEYNIHPVYLPLGSEIKIAFDQDIENMEIYSFILREDGSMKYYVPNPLTEPQAYVLEDGKLCLVELKRNITSGLSSLSFDYYDGNTLMGYLLRYESQGEKLDTFFVVRTDARHN